MGQTIFTDGVASSAGNDESNLSLSFTNLQAELGFYLGYGRSSWTAAATTEIEAFIQGGLRRFYGAYNWPFLRPVTTLTLSAPYSTGTVTVTASSTTATLASGTWPSWVASGVFTHNGVTYDVETRSSDSVILLATAFTGTTASAQTYQVSQLDYDLPDAFGGFLSEITFDQGTISITDEASVRRLRANHNGTSIPMVAAWRHKVMSSGTSGQRAEIMFGPGAPDDAYVISYRYQVIPSKISASNLYAYGGMFHTETILAACLAVAEERIKDARGERYAAYMELLAMSVRQDQLSTAPETLGFNREMDCHTDWRGSDLHVTTYNGVAY